MIERINSPKIAPLILLKNYIVMKKLNLLFFSLSLFACGSGNSESSENKNSPNASTEVSIASSNPSYDPNRGVGKFTDVEVSPTLDAALASKGQGAFDVKCSSCHKTTDEKLVGPGWKGVTQRHKPAWILNFMTNTDEMINKDPAVQAQLEICLVRMPNQNLTDDEAKSLLEFMRQNDGVK